MKKTLPKICAYVRVSTLSQDYRSQVHALREFCRRSGWTFPAAPLFFSEKVSGKKGKRTQLDRMLSACRDGAADTVLCYKIDRLGNSLANLVNLIQELDRLKIRLIGVADGVDTATSNASTNLLRNTLATGAQFNRELISERTLAGLRAARARGRIGGKPRKNDAAIKRALVLFAKKTLTLKKISEQTNLSSSYLSRIFSGQRKGSTAEPVKVHCQNLPPKKRVFPLGDEIFAKTIV